jgi:hypothetical protein
MTGTVHVVQSLFHPHERTTHVITGPAGTIGDVAKQFLDPTWGEDPDVALLVNGRKIRDERELDLPFEDGTDLVVVPEVGEAITLTFVIQAVVTALISAAVGFAIAALMGRPKLRSNSATIPRSSPGR